MLLEALTVRLSVKASYALYIRELCGIVTLEKKFGRTDAELHLDDGLMIDAGIYTWKRYYHNE